MKEISDKLYADLEYLGIIDDCVRSHNIGKSNYSERLIQPWTIWLSYPELTSFDHDIIKRVLRTIEGDSRRMDYEKIIHICKERIRQIDVVEVGGYAIRHGKTSPPKRYTSGSMVLAMENAGQLIEDEELREQIKGSGIGTPATRAEIIKKLIRIGYLILN